MVSTKENGTNYTTFLTNLCDKNMNKNSATHKVNDNKMPTVNMNGNQQQISFQDQQFNNNSSIYNDYKPVDSSNNFMNLQNSNLSIKSEPVEFKTQYQNNNHQLHSNNYQLPQSTEGFCTHNQHENSIDKQCLICRSTSSLNSLNYFDKGNLSKDRTINRDVHANNKQISDKQYLANFNKEISTTFDQFSTNNPSKNDLTLSPTTPPPNNGLPNSFTNTFTTNQANTTTLNNDLDLPSNTDFIDTNNSGANYLTTDETTNLNYNQLEKEDEPLQFNGVLPADTDNQIQNDLTSRNYMIKNNGYLDEFKNKFEQASIDENNNTSYLDNNSNINSNLNNTMQSNHSSHNIHQQIGSSSMLSAISNTSLASPLSVDKFHNRMIGGRDSADLQVNENYNNGPMGANSPSSISTISSNQQIQQHFQNQIHQGGPYDPINKTSLRNLHQQHQPIYSSASSTSPSPKNDNSTSNNNQLENAFSLNKTTPIAGVSNIETVQNAMSSSNSSSRISPIKNEYPIQYQDQNQINYMSYGANSNSMNQNFNIKNMNNETTTAAKSETPKKINKKHRGTDLTKLNGQSHITKTGGGRVKSAHNVIEQRYRNKINDKFNALQESVPTLRVLLIRKLKEKNMKHRMKSQQQDKNNEYDDDDEMDEEEEDFENGSDLKIDGLLSMNDIDENEIIDLEGLEPARKLNKGTILAKSIEYIKFLENKNLNLKFENQNLLSRLG
ncbi:uncharacterized protein KGF55_002126 [Candida pseudojiufengensis]|uniref:uncharacterized protein n=1 Tax=Candida pseudojiufengensis TaxID=497109 RepID=UPI0022253696|nr:uncharacterized protein KGF55_002126 [Candida pseudojiufengensis]KAI5964184.1 hypothetical protein KGF55_002126 [Candida pseudojiufengensis]